MTKSRRPRPAQSTESLLREYVRDVLLEEGLIDGIEAAVKFTGGNLGSAWGKLRNMSRPAREKVQRSLVAALELTPGGQESFDVLLDFSVTGMQQAMKSMDDGLQLLVTLLGERKQELESFPDTVDEAAARISKEMMSDSRMNRGAAAAGARALADETTSGAQTYLSLTRGNPGLLDPEPLRKILEVALARAAGAKNKTVSASTLKSLGLDKDKAANRMKQAIENTLSDTRKVIGTQLSTITKKTKEDPIGLGKPATGALKALTGAS